MCQVEFSKGLLGDLDINLVGLGLPEFHVRDLRQLQQFVVNGLGQFTKLTLGDGITDRIQCRGSEDTDGDDRLKTGLQSDLGPFGFPGEAGNSVDRRPDLVDNSLWLADVGVEFGGGGAASLGGARSQLGDADDRSDGFLDLQADASLGLGGTGTRVEHSHLDLVGAVLRETFTSEHRRRGDSDGQGGDHYRIHRWRVANRPGDQ